MLTLILGMHSLIWVLGKSQRHFLFGIPHLPLMTLSRLSIWGGVEPPPPDLIFGLRRNKWSVVDEGIEEPGFPALVLINSISQSTFS